MFFFYEKSNVNNLVYFSVNLQKRYALFPFQNNISFVEKISVFWVSLVAKSIISVL